MFFGTISSSSNNNNNPKSYYIFKNYFNDSDAILSTERNSKVEIPYKEHFKRPLLTKKMITENEISKFIHDAFEALDENALQMAQVDYKFIEDFMQSEFLEDE